MKKDEIIKENLGLLNEFMKIAFEQPDIMDKVPNGAELIILPENDPKLYKANLKIKHSLEKKGKTGKGRIPGDILSPITY